MGELAIGMLRDAIQALMTQNEELADHVLAKNDELLELDTKIENKALELLTLFQPMAIDLRTIACIFKMITYLTRIGRYGKDIAKVSKELMNQPHVSKLVNIPHMTENVCRMINDTLSAFETGDLSGLSDLGERDDDVDAQRYSIFRECISYMMEDPKNITRCTHYVMIARYLERCGDHACKMAEKIHYMINGEHIEIR